MHEITIGIGVFFPSLQNRRIAEGALAGLESVAALRLDRRSIAEVFWTYDRFLDAARAGQLAGAIVFANYHEVAFGLKGIPSVASLGIPVLDTSDRYREPPLPAIVPDNVQVGRMAADLFHQRGCEAALFVGFPEDYHFSTLRREGFEAEAAGRGMRVLPARIGPIRGGSEARSIEIGLDEIPPQTGIFAANDEIAKVLWRALRGSGRRVPEELLLIGVDNEFGLTSPTGGLITSIDPGGFAVGKRAALAMVAHIFDGEPLRREVLSGFQSLHERDTTRPPAWRDSVVARALQVASPQIPDVRSWAAQARVPCRTMERHFKQALGRSPRACLAEWKMERAMHLLRTTDWTIERVAAEAGFADAKWFFQAFRKATGRTPGAFRAVR